MKIGDLIEFLGWITIISFGIAISSFFLKYINKKYINKLGKEKKQIVNWYRKIMKIVIKNHKLAGIIAVLAVLTHSLIAFSSKGISITGIIAAVLMASTFILGIYGSFIKKSNKGIWLKIHRLIPFALIIAIVIHVL